ncbi:MAG TPA: hypothetical protein VI279_12920 [Rhodocyclaceae bacterium]
MAENNRRVCPKCGYRRTENETAPDYECPKCGIVYAKAVLHAAPVERPEPEATDSGASGAKWVKLALTGVAVLGIGYWQMRAKPQPAPAAPVAAAPAPAAAAAPAAKSYASTVEYAQDKVNVQLGDVQGNMVLSKVINNGDRDLSNVFVKVKGLKQWVPDPRFKKEETPEEYEVEMTNGPFPAGSTKESVLKFPQGVQTLVGGVSISNAY